MSKKEEILIANYCFNNFSYSINSRLPCKYEINFFVWANAYKIPFFSPSLGSTKHLVSYNPHKMTADQEKKGDDKISKEERLTQYSNTEFFHIQEQILQHILLFYNFLFSWFQDFKIDYEHLVTLFFILLFIFFFFEHTIFFLVKSMSHISFRTHFANPNTERSLHPKIEHDNEKSSTKTPFCANN